VPVMALEEIGKLKECRSIIEEVPHYGLSELLPVASVYCLSCMEDGEMNNQVMC
jgi:hypothetical protein